MKNYNLTEDQLRNRLINAFIDGINSQLQTHTYEVQYTFAEAKANRIIDALQHENN
jgi:acyl-homoserine lactone acylase PvdQ